LTFAFTSAPRRVHKLKGHRSSTFLRFNIDDIESRAQSASDAWDVDVTSFLNAADTALIEDRLGGRADVACIRVDGRGVGQSSSSRARFVFTNPDMGIDSAAAEAEHCVVLRLERASLGLCDPWANALANIGVDLENVGDIVVHSDDGSVYLVVSPDVAKICTRLLPKEIRGTGVTVSALEPGEGVPEGGELQDMEMQRLDKRAQKRK